MSNVHSKLPALLICFVGMTLASAAVAQAPRSSVDIAATTGAPEFRDPKTGQVWTPETVGQDGRPLTGPDDKAFDPQAQSAPPRSPNSACAAGPSAPCRSPPDRPCRSSSWTVLR